MNQMDGIRDVLTQKFGSRVLFDCDGAQLTTMRTGGKIFALVDVQNEDEIEFLFGMKQNGIAVRFLGCGSNVLLGDRGFKGIICISRGFATINADGAKISTGSGLLLKKFLAFSIGHGLKGAEFLAGVPGTIGGALMLNAGTKTEYISQLLSSVKFLDQSGSWQEKESSSIPWGYRDSGLRNEAFFIAKASFVLHPSSSIEVRKTIQQYMQMRKLTQPWDLPSAGSVFKNPPGMFAGKLIEEAGLKGFAIGGARISEKHANFIVNTGGATAQDVRFLMEHVQKVVMAKYNIMLEPEIELIGDFL